MNSPRPPAQPFGTNGRAAVPRLILNHEQQRLYFLAIWDGASNAEACQIANIAGSTGRKYTTQVRARARCVLGLPPDAPLDPVLVLRLIFDPEQLARDRAARHDHHATPATLADAAAPANPPDGAPGRAAGPVLLRRQRL